MTANGRQPPMEDDFQWKTTSKGRRPQIIKSGISQQQMYQDILSSWGEIRGKPRGNLECGSAQPSLFRIFFGKQLKTIFTYIQKYIIAFPQVDPSISLVKYPCHFQFQLRYQMEVSLIIIS
jgi:hypothetical protein